ncbi:MAG: O-antigen ligase family protein [Bdellovibrio sp.]
MSDVGTKGRLKYLRYSIALAFLSLFISWKITDIFFALGFTGIIFTLFSNNAAVVQRSLRVFRKTDVLLLVWGGASILGYFFGAPQVGPEQLEEMAGLRWIAAYFIAIYWGSFLAQEESRPQTLWLVLLSVMVLATLPYQEGLAMLKVRYEGVFGNVNVAACVLLLPWAFLLAWDFCDAWERREIDAALILTLVVLTTLLFFTQTRGVWLAMIGTLLLMFIIRPSKRYIGVLGVIVVTLAGFYFLNIFGFRDRIIYSFNLSPDSSQGIRLELWKAYWKMFLDYPLLGVGFYETVRLLPSFYGNSAVYEKLFMGGAVFGHAHNQYLQILAGSGVIGFAAWSWFFISLLRESIVSFKSTVSPYIKRLCISMGAVLFAFLLCGIFESPMMLHPARLGLFILVGCALGVIREKTRLK